MRLPRTASKLIRLAVNDLIKVERSPKYRVNMEIWHDGANEDEECDVCLAGAVIAKTFRVDRHHGSGPDDFSGDNRSALFALNNLREGSLTEALFCDLDAVASQKRRDQVEALENKTSIPEYWASPKRFKKAMRRLANNLARLGF